MLLNRELVSLFCGAGGLDLGFERAQFSVAAAVDLRSYSISSYNHNRAEASGHVADVTELTPTKIDTLAGREIQPAGIIGGPPCQSFSQATHNKDDDARHSLPLEFARILKAFNRRAPVSFFALENVPGLLKKKHSKRLAGIIDAFEDAGFNVASSIVNASWFRVPQDRSRLIIVGFNRKLYPNLQWTPPPPAIEEPIPVKDVIKGLPAPAFWSRDIDFSKIDPHPNHWCMVPKSKNFLIRGSLVPGTSRGRSFRTLDWNRPSPTVAYGHREVHVHPSGKRRLSVYEAMLIQGFPKRYKLLGNLSEQVTQVSEAVPPPLAHAIALSIARSLKVYNAAS